jgi:aldehyde:ferredoxin oxidoreductase
VSHGYNGKILHVDLTEHAISIEQPLDSFYRQYGGGSAMGCYYLLREMRSHEDPLGPGNVLTIFVSPVTGAPVPGQSRVSICAKSPLTGGVGDSQGGGFWPAYFKMAGFDGIVVTGKAEKPVYLRIHDEAAELRDARHLWGRTTGEVEREIRSELQDHEAEVLQIGPAGEKLVRFANVISMSNRANGRTGMGAVMGSKNLRGIVVQGKRKLGFANPSALGNMARWGHEHLEDSGVHGLGLCGTAKALEEQRDLGGLPTRNWTAGDFEGHEAINAVALNNTLLKARDTCFACIVRCKRVVEKTDSGYQLDPLYGGPEYETLAAFGSFCGVSDLAAVGKANELCNAYGADTISCGASIAWAMECFERGTIGLRDTQGIDLRFGNAAAMVRMVELIAKREGFGDVLAEGSARAAARLGAGAVDLLVAAKKQELPAHMPEAKRSLALIYALNPYGADHMSSEHDPSYASPPAYAERMAEIGLMDPQPATTLNAEKVRFAMRTQWVYNACNSLCVCQFIYGPSWQLYSTSQLVDLVAAATGWNFSIAELMKLGERTVNMQRAFNTREGFTSADDRLPNKLFRPRVGGLTDGVSVSEAELSGALRTYYQMAGWDQEGCPTTPKLKALGIGWVGETISQGST